jgi:hypothetical protein
MARGLLALKLKTSCRFGYNVALEGDVAKRSRDLPSLTSLNSYAIGKGTSNMERQRHICVIDWFGVNYDGTMPTILLACDENWFGLFPVAPPNPPALESADWPDGPNCFYR